MSIRTRLSHVPVALAAVAVLASGQAQAVSLPQDTGFGDVAGIGADSADATVRQSNGPSLSDAIERVRRKYPGGRIIDANTRRSGNREVHVIKVLTRDNKVRTERINGRRLNNRG